MTGQGYTKKRTGTEEVSEAEAPSSICPDNGTNSMKKDKSLGYQICEEHDNETNVDDKEINNKACNTFSIDHSKNGRAKCKECGKTISIGELRIGKYVPFKNIFITKFFHLNCAFESFKRARISSSVITEINDVNGVNLLTEDEQLLLKEFIDKSINSRKKPLPIETARIRRIPPKSTANERLKLLKSTNIPSMKVLFTNSDQLTTLTELKTKIKLENPLIVAVSEVKVKNRTTIMMEEDYIISDYTIHPLNLGNNTGRGIAVYTHNSIEKSVTQISLDERFEEVCALEIRLRGGDLLLFCCFYRSPTHTETSDCNNDKLVQLFQKIGNDKNYSHRCILGDFNFRDINWSSGSTHLGEHSLEARFIEAVRDSYLYQHITEPTRRRGNDNPSLIDLVFSDEEMQISDIQHHSPLGKSDHSVIILNYHCYLDYSKPKETYIYTKGDYHAMREDLQNSNWSSMFTEMIKTSDKTTDELWNIMKSKLHYLRNKYIRMFKNSGKPTWSEKGTFPISKNTYEAIRNKKKTHRQWMLALKNGDENFARLQYTKARNRASRAIRLDKRNFEKGIAFKCKRNPKLFWSHARRKLKTKRGISPLLQDINNKDSLKYEDAEKVDILLQQFSSVFTEEPPGDIPRISQRCTSDIIISPFTEERVRTKLKKLDPNKSTGPDDIHAMLLAELTDYIAKPLAALFNLTLKTGKLPYDWKLAYISPIYKKGAKNRPENYRPISLTSIVCKIIESIIREEILLHLKQYKLISTKQHGFISGRSTVTQLLKYLDTCADMVANGNVVDSIYLDFQKAFDTVPHSRLIGKLEAYGIVGPILVWIKDYLHERTQHVVINGTKSKQAPVISGIPQGTVLGPLLFVLYINDLLDDITSQGLLYADDSKIFRQISSQKDSEELQKDTKTLEDWSTLWLLKFHPGKCHVLTLGKFENIKYTNRYRICGQEMEHVFSEKDLGVTFDENISFDEHIANKINKANSVMGLIRRSFSYLDCKSFMSLYCAFVRPHLEYGQSIWSPHLRKHINALEAVQIRATKQVDNLSNMAYPERLKKLNLPTLAYRRLRGDLIEMFKHVNIYDSEILPSVFQRRSRPSRKHGCQLYERTAKDGFRGVQLNSFYYRVPKVWNNLPSSVIEAKTINSFKNRLDDYLSNHPMRFNITTLPSDP